MKIIAILAVRNERGYLANCLAHLIENGLDFAVIDNDSSDGSYELLNQSPYKDHLVEYVHYPYPGFFDWKGLMQAREAAALRSGADWVLFVSADEVMNSYRANETLSDAIGRVAATGAEVIDFNEFVFLPIDQDYVPDLWGYQPLRHYYFFEPNQPRLMRARNNSLLVSHVEHGGHFLSGAEYKLSDEKFALRHYIFQNQEHAKRKYRDRVFSKEELARNWHSNRHNQPEFRFQFPEPKKLEQLPNPEDRRLIRSHPYDLHYWQWPE